MSITIRQKQKIESIIDSQELNIYWDGENPLDILRGITNHIMKKESNKDKNKMIEKIFTHSLYVRRFSIYILEKDENLNTKENLNKLLIAETFHDLGKILEYNIENYNDDIHAEYSEYITELILKKQNKLNNIDIKEICKMIRYHSLKGNKCPKDASKLDKILMDADLLDEKCGQRFFKLCMNIYTQEVFSIRIKEKIEEKRKKKGKTKLKNKQINAIIENCKKDNLNHENYELLYKIIYKYKNENKQKINEKSVIPELSKQVYEEQILISDSLFASAEVFAFVDDYFNEIVNTINK